MKFYLCEIRTKKGISIRTLAELSGISKSQIQIIESGNANPTIKTLCRLAHALGVPIFDLFSCD